MTKVRGIDGKEKMMNKFFLGRSTFVWQDLYLKTAQKMTKYKDLYGEFN